MKDYTILCSLVQEAKHAETKIVANVLDQEIIMHYGRFK